MPWEGSSHIMGLTTLEVGGVERRTGRRKRGKKPWKEGVGGVDGDDLEWLPQDSLVERVLRTTKVTARCPIGLPNYVQRVIRKTPNAFPFRSIGCMYECPERGDLWTISLPDLPFCRDVFYVFVWHAGGWMHRVFERA